MSASTRYPIINFKRHAIAIGLDVDNSYSFDHSGRLFFALHRRVSYRRGLDNTLVEKTRARCADVEQRVRRVLDEEEKRGILSQIYDDTRYALDGMRPSDGTLFVSDDGRADEVLSRLRELFTDLGPQQLSASGEQFSRVYEPIAILPPDSYLSLVVQISRGCHWNRCTFCDFYRGMPFGAVSWAQLEEHLCDIREFFGRGMSQRRGVFLGGANALLLPTEQLTRAMRLIRDEFEEPASGGFSSFIDLLAARRKPKAELLELVKSGLNRVAIGVETGHDPLLRWVDKQGSAEETHRTVTRFKQAGIHVSCIFIVGLGGARYRDAHLRDSVQIVSSLPLVVGDIIYLSPLRARPSSPYVEHASRDGIVPLEPAELARELIRFKMAMKSVTNSVKVTQYDVDEFVY